MIISELLLTEFVSFEHLKTKVTSVFFTVLILVYNCREQKSEKETLK